MSDRWRICLPVEDTIDVRSTEQTTVVKWQQRQSGRHNNRNRKWAQTWVGVVFSRRGRRVSLCTWFFSIWSSFVIYFFLSVVFFKFPLQKGEKERIPHSYSSLHPSLIRLCVCFCLCRQKTDTRHRCASTSLCWYVSLSLSLLSEMWGGNREEEEDDERKLLGL